MANEQVQVGHTCGHNSIVNTRDAKDTEHFKAMIKKITMSLCDNCLRDIAAQQTDKGGWK